MSRAAIARLIAAATLVAWPGVQAAAQVPKLLAVPDDFTGATRASLEREWSGLRSRLTDLQAHGAAFNRACADVKAGSAADQRCQSEYGELRHERQTYAADASRYNERLRNATAAQIALATSWPGTLPLPEPSWDCYCIYRYVTRPNGATHAEPLRTPEGQVAYDALKALDRDMAALTRARERAFSLPEDRFGVLLRAAAEHIPEHVAMHALAETVGGPPGLLIAVGGYSLALKAAAIDVPAEMHDVVEAKQALEDASRRTAQDLEEWQRANERAKNSNPVGHVLAKPYTMTFTNGADGAIVAIVTPSEDDLVHARVVAR